MKVALVTGGSSGIGAGVARRLRASGVKVVVADVAEPADVRCDVSVLEDNLRAVDFVMTEHGRLDLAFLNAGVASGCGVGDDFDPALYRRAMGVNLDGVVFGAHAAIPALRASGGGVIVATASMAGIVGIPLDPIYAANKHAVVGLVRSLGVTLAPDGIKVQALCPSFADTAILGDARVLLEAEGFPIMEVDQVVDAFEKVVASEGTGECWFVVPGRESEPFTFRRAPGPR
ncbi:SDR family NAD(P)-dependent oxidoreductase [Herbidospora sp. NEAU-GS84]|uniref:SDR family NAD(P)-dependent oxidoreductase n=1 Tax=Herbidospora solisilvae TaxID=2696284 RepID=A0A7C9J0T7_9ACTN|nr:SDR family NAD(P)-dependent oxidoreductase [Herbidospora solisilvae]NAS20480.1 SDR family NAD(P)-dependent oxidoreductase [Herbidospora solisilvae]